jgi:hypothetical protein
VGGWERDASIDPEVIKKWFSEDPEINYGCMAGADTFVFDIDMKSHDGFATAKNLLGEDFDLNTFRVKTPTGGEHRYYRSDKVYGNTAGTIGAGLDTRSGNGYVVGPGSALYVPDEFEPDLHTLRTYDVISDTPLVAIPEKLRIKLNEKKDKAANAQSSLHPDFIDTPENIELANKLLSSRDPAVIGDGGDTHTVHTAKRVRDYNISEEMCYELMDAEGGWNQSLLNPWAPDELKLKIHNGYLYADRPMGTKALVATGSLFGDGEDSPVIDFNTPSKPIVTSGYTFYDGSAVLSLNRHYDFIINQWLPTKNYTIVLGARGSGKTTVIVDAICHAASDADWHEAEVDHGWFFIYIAGEDFEGVKERYEAWCSTHKDLCKYNKDTDRWQLKDPSRLQFIDMAVDLMNEDAVIEFTKAVMSLAAQMRSGNKEIKIAVVVDTWQRMTAGAVGGQSSDEAMQKALNHIEGMTKKFKGPCIIAAHPPKANSNTMSGSGIIENRSDAVWNIVHIGAGVREATVTRIKGAPEGTHAKLRFNSVDINGADRFGRQRRSVYTVFNGGSGRDGMGKVVTPETEWQRRQDLLILLRDMLANGQNYDPTDPHGGSLPKMTKMVENLYQGPKAGCDENIRIKWIESLRLIGFKDAEMKPQRHIKDHPFFKIVAEAAEAMRLSGEIGKSGEGITWRRHANKYILSYGPISGIGRASMDEEETIVEELDLEDFRDEEDFGESK